MADFHALCADLVRVADALDGRTPLTSNQGQALDGYSALAEFRHVADRARALLAHPVEEGPSADELMDMAEFFIEDNGLLGLHNAGEFARAVLDRWGTSNLAEVRSSLEDHQPLVEDDVDLYLEQ